MLKKLFSSCILMAVCSTGFAASSLDCKPESILQYLTGTWKGGNGVTLKICADIKTQNDGIRRDYQDGYEEYEYPFRPSCVEDSSSITLVSREPVNGTTITSTVNKNNPSSLISASRLGNFVLGR